ncbi:hypothetical protein D918_02650 [Trichuris suis]|nr:hypothetical protein D918_02650 [Trichuris suis]
MVKHLRTSTNFCLLSSELNAVWDHRRSIQNNMKLAGLVYDVNKHFGSLSTMDSLKQKSSVEVVSAPKEPTKTAVVEALEKAASVRPPKRLRLSKAELKFIVSMMEKHGSDYILLWTAALYFKGLAKRTVNSKANKVKLLKRTDNRLKPEHRRIRKKVNGNKDEPKIREVPRVSSALFLQYNARLGPPYHILLDTNFVNFSIKNKLDIIKSMTDCLYAKCKFFRSCDVYTID